MVPGHRVVPQMFDEILPIAVLIVLYHVVIRRWHLAWGTVGDEARRSLPGDDFVPHATIAATHAITIRAPAGQIWPWLVQLGQGKGGFYSYTWLQNLFGCQITNASEIVPGWQALDVGDPVPLHPQAAPLRVIAMNRGRSLVLGGVPDQRPETSEARRTESRWSWTFVLDEHHANETRLIVRARSSSGQRWNDALLHYLIGEPIHFIMERGMLRGIKRRAEAA